MKSKKKLIIWSAVGLFFAVIIGLTIWGNTSVALNNVTITDSEIPKDFNGYRIALVSDLHSSRLWEKAIAKVEKAEPDIVVIAGDLISRDDVDVERALNFVLEMMKITEGFCFYIPGNHEKDLPEETYAQLVEGMRSMGVRIMDENDPVAMIINGKGEYIALVGDAAGDPSKVGQLGSNNTPYQNFDGYKILLTHNPAYFDDYAAAGFDLVLSGHTHGGQIRLPFIGAVYCPDQGFFPEYDSGVITKGDSTIVISRGIGNSSFPIRFLCRPEVVVIELQHG